MNLSASSERRPALARGALPSRTCCQTNIRQRTLQQIGELPVAQLRPSD